MAVLSRPRGTETVLELRSGDRPVLLGTLGVPFHPQATAFAVDSAVEGGRPLVVVDLALAPFAAADYGIEVTQGQANQLTAFRVVP